MSDSILQVNQIKDKGGNATGITVADNTANVTIGNLTTTLSSTSTVPASVGGNEILLDTYDANNTVSFKVFEFTGSYNVYRLRINYLRCSLDNSELKVDLGSSSSSFSSSSSDYRFVGHHGRSNGSNHYGGQLHVVNSSFIHFDNTGGGDSEGCSLDVLIVHPTASTTATFAYGNGYVYRQDNYVMPFSIATTAKYNPRNDSHLKIYFNQGNLSKGKILLYGVKDA